MPCYLKTMQKSDCSGCMACAQACRHNAIHMEQDEEGFFYPVVAQDLCVHCEVCYRSCPYETPPEKSDQHSAYGGYIKDEIVREQSTSGGAFSAIVDSFCDEDYVIFGAKANGLHVFHTYVRDKSELAAFRKSKYLQSDIGTSYCDAEKFLEAGKKVVFSGTPCQIAGLKSYLKSKASHKNLLTIEVVCEGVPSPLFIGKYDAYLLRKYGAHIKEIDYRFKDMRSDGKGRWDYQVMNVLLQNGKRLKRDRWFNPFWSIWLLHLMSRPSCYCCPYAVSARVADITLGDLWGVHLYCPELYGDNGGASLIICNTPRGIAALNEAKGQMYGHELDFSEAIKYQSPMRKPIDVNPNRETFMRDLLTEDYTSLCRKWSNRPTVKLLISKYIWGTNQQKCRR